MTEGIPAGAALVELMRQTARRSIEREDLCDLCSGVVEAAEPLRIRVDERLTLPARFLLLSPLCREKRVIMRGGEEVLLWRGLRAGDGVYMLRCQDGQKYLCLMREGEED